MFKKFCLLITSFLVLVCVASPCLLFRTYPQLERALARVELADLPTPLVHLERLGAELGNGALYIKRDDLTGALRGGIRLFGGNKVRKLEFLLADALKCGAIRVITNGCAASNHALATAVYAHELGLKCGLVLSFQHASSIVRRNLLLDLYYGAQIHPHTNGLRADLVEQVRQNYQAREGRAPYVIPTGGSIPRGAVGFVNASFELKQQVDAGLMPVPHKIYVPLGSAGTMAGLVVGLRAAGLPSQVVGVAVEGHQKDMSENVLKLVRSTNAFLHDNDPAFRLYEWSESDFFVDGSCVGAGYGIPLDAGGAAADLMQRTQGYVLEQTYTAKACAAFVRDAQLYRDQTLLFWNTFSAGDFTDLWTQVDPKTLPHEFYSRYFAVV